MNSARTARPRLRAWVATLLTAVLVAGGVTLVASPANAATGDVTGATLSWGVKESFRNYITGPIAAGSITLTDVSGPAPYGWTGGTGTADQAAATGTVGYPGSINFYGHAGALNVTFSNVSITQTSATSATLFSNGTSLATLDLAGGTNDSTADTVAFTGVPAIVSAEGAPLFAGFYPAGTALDPVSFSWPVEQAPAGPAVTTTTLTASTASPAINGTAVTLTATVSPVAEGTVQFSDGATALGAPIAVLNGVASYTATAFAAASHTFSAVFTPTDAVAYAGSTGQLAFQVVVPTPTVTVTKTTGLSPAGETITITGTGFNPQAPATNGTRPPLSGAFGGTYVVFGKFADVWKPSAGALSATRKVSTQKWVLDPANVATVGGAGAGAVAINADGSFSVDLVVKPGFTGEPATGNYGIYTYGGSGASYAAFETYTPISFSTAPTVVVSKTTELSPAGETVTVTGYNFGPNAPGTNGARPPLAGVFGGSYVVFGKFADAWKPSAGAPSSTRKVSTQKWVVDPSSVDVIGGAGAGAVAINPDGSFSVQLAVKPGFTGEPATGNYGIYTYGGSGSNYAAFETYTPVAFASATATTTTLAADPANGLLLDDTTTLTATVSPVADGTVTFKDGSTVLATQAVAAGVATFTTGPLSEGAHSFTADFAPTAPLLFAASSGSLTVSVTRVPAIVTTTTLTSSATALADGDSTVLTATVAPSAAGTVTFGDGTTVLGSAPVAGGKATFGTAALSAGTHAFTAAFAPADPLVFAASSGALDLTVASPTLTNPLNWGVKESFRSYVTGSIANGAITTSGVGVADGSFLFGSTTGGTYTGDAGTGTAMYAGSVHFTGHAGALDLTLSDPYVSVESPTSGVLYVSVNGQAAVPFATLDLSVATKVTTDTTVAWTDAAASLTAEGAAAFSLGGQPFYPVGTALDPVSFVIAATTTPPVIPAVPTSVTLTATPVAGALIGASVSLSSTVTPAASGSIRFYNGATLLGSRPVTAVTATATQSFTTTAAGTITLRAEFVPADLTKFAGSSTTLAYTVTAPVAPVTAEGSLTWGVKQSFRDYVTGGIAQGAIRTSGVGSSGGAFVFGQSSGGTFNGSTGTSNYSGSVRFTGHSGQLDLTLANPVVSVESPSSATLYVTVNGGASVPFATLDLASGSRSTPGNAVAWADVPATLTSVGASAFAYNGSQFYAPGTALDSLTFVVGAQSSQGGATQTIAAYQPDREPADTPPATTGLTVTDPSKIVSGGEITVTGEGFEANEDGILAVIYSTPVVLSRTVTADASGKATFTGRLPAGLTGKHTFTLQGSVNRGVVIDIPAKFALAETGCAVQSSTLTWGFKESFRSYISGSIANGEWTVANGATYETPYFGWIDGDGSYDGETSEGLVAFAGSITFTGHGGILNTTVSNPTIRFIDAEHAVMLVDISGTTQEGAAIDQKGVEFVDLDLSGAVTNDGGVVTVTDAPATLTAAGSEAFGTYEAGEAFDPVTIELGIDPACATIATPEATTQPVEPISAETNLWWIWLVVGLLVLAALAAVIVVVVRRRA